MPADQVVTMKSLLEAGVHFGHRTRRWNPKMKRYIFTERNGIHIIDLQQTIKQIGDAFEMIKDTVSQGGVVLFVGTKKQAQENIAHEALRCNMPFVNQRWLGGTLTNWRTIRQRIDYLLEIERQQARGEFSRLIKKEALMREREIARLNHRLGGLKEMRRLPNIMFVVDVRRDAIAVKEANTLGIPVIAMVDTNCDPDPIDLVIPSNDDAIRALKLMIGAMASAVLEGQAILSSIKAEEEELASLEGEEAMESLLGPSTLAKIQATSDEEEVPVAAVEAEAAEPMPVQEPVAEEPAVEVVEEAATEDSSAEAEDTEVVATEAAAPEEVASEEVASESGADEPAAPDEASSEDAVAVEAESAQPEDSDESETPVENTPEEEKETV